MFSVCTTVLHGSDHHLIPAMASNPTSSPTSSPDLHPLHLLLCTSRATYPPDDSESSTLQRFSEPPPATSRQPPSGTDSPLDSLRRLSLSTIPNAFSPKLEEEEHYFQNAAGSPPSMMICELVSSNSTYSGLTLICHLAECPRTRAINNSTAIDRECCSLAT